MTYDSSMYAETKNDLLRECKYIRDEVAPDQYRLCLDGRTVYIRKFHNGWYSSQLKHSTYLGGYDTFEEAEDATLYDFGLLKT